jgi:hypothetical protein
MTITILDRFEVIGMFGMESSWNFQISSTDATTIQADHFGLAIDTNVGTNRHPSLPTSPWSEIYTSYTGGSITSDPYNQIVGGWKVITGSGLYYLTFIYYYQPTWTNINDWTNFQWSPTGGTGSIPTLTTPLDEIKCRSTYLFIKPEVEPGTCAIYDLQAGSSSTYYTYTDCASGNDVNQLVPAYTTGVSNCAVVGSMTGGSYSIFSYCGGTYSTPSITYDTLRYNITSWNGDIVTDKPTTISYVKEKQKVASVQTNTYINLSNLLKEKLEGDITNYVIQNNPTQSQNIGIKESKWAYVEGDFYHNAVQLGRTFSNDFFVIDGYTEPGEDQGLIRPFTPGWQQRVLLTDWYRRQYTQYSHVRIHFKTQDLVAIDSYPGNVYPGSTTSTPISFVANPDISNEYIQSILVDTTQDMTYVFNYTTSGEVVWTSVTPNCKFENFDVVFKNKWGVLETLSFAKKSTKTLMVTDSDYLRGIVNYNGEFDVTRHTRKHFNTSGSEEWTLNTDWVPEYMNDAFKELMLSEEIWLVDRWNTITPVNKVDTQFSYKTSLNDKLIQYTMKVKLSHNIINNIL